MEDTERLVAALGMVSPEWREAFRAVPRAAFLTRFFRPVAGGYAAIAAGDPGFASMVYRDSVLPTEIDDDDSLWDYAREHGPVDGVPTSSSSQPSLMGMMLDALGARPGHRVLEIGTGTGWNAALLCHRLGSAAVTTIDIDAALVARAREALAALGFTPAVDVADGANGYPPNAPYDRILATCAVATIPHAWVTQATVGGRILASIYGHLGAGTMPLLEVTAPGVAEGHVLATGSYFMPLRAQRLPDLLPRSSSPGVTRPTQVYLDSAAPWSALAELRLPGVAATNSGYDQWLLHSDGSWAHSDGDRVTQGGPRRLWDILESAHADWSAHGRPPRTAIHIRVDQTGQHTWLA
ncbi:methyltransferase domain-containing protein [Longispora albida]|uniref:methyltransferase domain-containing protein n=1 Tax=Longispora albida TaxID=203523 RepID=UPI000374AD8F|nr:methyltransferase domain-containing protein [Longispora albida]